MENIKEHREAKDMTQVEAAKKIGVSLSAYRLWEQGVMEPKPENMRRLCEVLEIEEQENA